MVGQLFLVQEIVGSNPTTPATDFLCVVRRESQLVRRETQLMSGKSATLRMNFRFLRVSSGLGLSARVPKGLSDNTALSCGTQGDADHDISQERHHRELLPTIETGTDQAAGPFSKRCKTYRLISQCRMWSLPR